MPDQANNRKPVQWNRDQSAWNWAWSWQSSWNQAWNSQKTESWASNWIQSRWQRGAHGQAWSWEREWPALQSINWNIVGRESPKPLRLDRKPNDPLPQAKAVVLCWTDAEWAAFDHVWAHSTDNMNYRYWEQNNWEADWNLYRRGWDSVASNLPWTAPSRWENAWGRFRLVSLGNDENPVLVVKSNMHLTTDGSWAPLGQFVDRIIQETNPYLLISAGTAAGTRDDQTLGSVVISNSAQFQAESWWSADSEWNSAWSSRFASSWEPRTNLLNAARENLFQNPPVNITDLENLASQVDAPLDRLINRDIEPKALDHNAQILTGVPVLTASSYDVATTAGNYSDYACIEWNDALIASICNDSNTHFGSVKSISDPIANASLTWSQQQQWTQLLSSTYSWYSAANSALAAWALLSDELS